jgi:hypothetical protein
MLGECDALSLTPRRRIALLSQLFIQNKHWCGEKALSLGKIFKENPFRRQDDDKMTPFCAFILSACSPELRRGEDVKVTSMSGNEADKSAKQFDQSMPIRREGTKLDEQYKSIGISAVSAAAQFSSLKKKKPTDQMS